MSDRILAIGAPLGSRAVLGRLLEALPADVPAPVVVTAHAGSWDERVFAASALELRVPEDAEPLEVGRVYLAPPERHLIVTPSQVRPSLGPQENLLRPAIDAMFRSVALAYGPQAIGILLAGPHEDGVAGLLSIEDGGGVVITEGTAPRIEHGEFGHRADVAGIADLLAAAFAETPDAACRGRPAATLDACVALEGAIAAGNLTFGAWLRCERQLERSGLACPACGAELRLLPDRRLVRLRCCCGRAYAAQTLMRVKAEERRTALQMLADASRDERTLARLSSEAGLLAPTGASPVALAA